MDKSISDKMKEININELDFDNKESIKKTFQLLFNFIEYLVAENNELKIDNQNLKNELNILKGEKGKPDIKPNKKNSDKPKNVNKNNKETNWKKGSKKGKIKIDREEVVGVDKTKLPNDAVFKGFKEIIIQNIVIKTDNVLYKLETYYSPSENKTFTASLDQSLQNTEFAPEIKALIYTLYYECRVTENIIASFLKTFGILISEGTISNILIKEKADVLTEEQKAIFEAGLKSSTYQQIDDTGMRVAGKNEYATVVCNNEYSAFFINSKKNRETVRQILSGRQDLKEGELIGSFKILIADDAGQFKKLTELLGLCWVHEERHYEKLVPFVPYNKELLDMIISQIWDFYNELKEYKLSPSNDFKLKLETEFDKIFLQTTGYDDLDKRLALTYAKRENLLLVLDYPEIPLHNNVSEQSARIVVIKRKISGGVRNQLGKSAWMNGLTILATSKKQAVNFYNYIRDIFAGRENRLHLADIILTNK